MHGYVENGVTADFSFHEKNGSEFFKEAKTK
jgi:hypothetical protein